MRKINNKKAAFEMSMGTIVIIVLAISMLILGLVLTKKIMCAGIVMTDKIDIAVSNQISEMFEQNEYGVKCMGTDGTTTKIGGGGRRQILCIIISDQPVKYTATDVAIDRQRSTGEDERVTIISSGGTWDEGTGKATETVAVFDVPKDIAATTTIVLTFTLTKQGGSPVTKTLYLDMVPSGFMTSAMC